MEKRKRKGGKWEREGRKEGKCVRIKVKRCEKKTGKCERLMLRNKRKKSIISLHLT